MSERKDHSANKPRLATETPVVPSAELPMPRFEYQTYDARSYAVSFEMPTDADKAKRDHLRRVLQNFAMT